MKLLIFMICFVCTSSWAAWTTPEGRNPVKQEIIKEIRDPASVKNVVTEPKEEAKKKEK